MGDVFLKLSDLLDRGLSNTAAKITNEIRSDFQNLGARMEAIEHKLDITVSRANQNTEHIHVIQEQLEVALNRIDDLENRSRRDNFRVRGIPESITDVPKAIQELIKSLIPELPPPIKLELDRAHRSLGPPRKDGSPRDVVVKPHFYSVKEEIMKISRQQSRILFQGQEIQIFADISPTTIQKRRALKPLLLILTQREIKYWWAFPFTLKFTLKGKTHSFTTFPEGERVLLSLKLISLDSAMDTTNTQVGSSKRQTPNSPISPSWKSNKSRRLREQMPT